MVSNYIRVFIKKVAVGHRIVHRMSRNKRTNIKHVPNYICIEAMIISFICKLELV